MIRVYTCIVGDLFHYGHANFLAKAKSLGDYLIVGVCSDEDCVLYKRKPILDLHERCEVIKSCKFVDEIIVSPPSVVLDDFLDSNRINILVHGDDSNEDQLRHFYEAAIRRGIYRSVPYSRGISTTEIISRIRSKPESEIVRRNFLC